MDVERSGLLTKQRVSYTSTPALGWDSSKQSGWRSTGADAVLCCAELSCGKETDSLLQGFSRAIGPPSPPRDLHSCSLANRRCRKRDRRRRVMLTTRARDWARQKAASVLSLRYAHSRGRARRGAGTSEKHVHSPFTGRADGGGRQVGGLRLRQQPTVWGGEHWEEDEIGVPGQ